MMKSRILVIGVLASFALAPAWISVGLSGDAGYTIWNNWTGFSWRAGPVFQLHSGLYAFGISFSYGKQITGKNTGQLECNVFKGLASARIKPLPILFIEAAGGYSLFSDYVYYDETADSLVIETTISEASPLLELGLGGRFALGPRLNLEVVAKNTAAFNFTGYWNPSGRVALVYDFGTKPEPDTMFRIVFTSDVDTIDPKVGVQPDLNTIAIIFGASDYEHPDVVKVEYALRDALIVRDYLVKILGFNEANVFVVSNPTLSDFATWFGTSAEPQAKLARKVSVLDNPRVFVYYSGHGVPSIKTGKPYLVPVDCDPNYPEQGGYALADLYANLKGLKADDITVIIDACFSGLTPRGSLLKEASPLIMEPVEFEAQTPSEFTVLSAAGGRQVANWLSSEQHGLFTYYFLKGLRGEADNGDGKLTWGELKSYVVREVSRTAAGMDREQIPVFAGDEERVLARWE